MLSSSRKTAGRLSFAAYGEITEDLERVAVDLSDHVGQEIFIRLTDRETVGWGHINFDDFRLHDAKPNLPAQAAQLG